ncbi:MAG: hypothetical protein FWG18_00515 [Alphaproteobacteria bacterium]|nr:hypothetical protein [Alphaproteobacteria bacterium]
MKDFENFAEYSYEKLRIKRNIKLRAFLINYIAVFAGWLFSLTALYDFLIMTFTWFTPWEAYVYIMGILGIWQVAGVVLFLFPALAIWWEMGMLRKRD